MEKNDLSFPLLSSVRIHFARRKAQEGGAAEPTSVRAVLVEAEDQDVYSMPNTSLLAMGPILRSLAASPEELKIVTLRDIGVLPHVGMVVDGQKCELALVLAAATEKIGIQKVRGRIPLDDETPVGHRLRQTELESIRVPRGHQVRF